MWLQRASRDVQVPSASPWIDSQHLRSHTYHIWVFKVSYISAHVALCVRCCFVTCFSDLITKLLPKTRVSAWNKWNVSVSTGLALVMNLSLWHLQGSILRGYKCCCDCSLIIMLISSHVLTHNFKAEFFGECNEAEFQFWDVTKYQIKMQVFAQVRWLKENQFEHTVPVSCNI